jgi:hypothetical protein
MPGRGDQPAGRIGRHALRPASAATPRRRRPAWPPRPGPGRPAGAPVPRASRPRRPATPDRVPAARRSSAQSDLDRRTLLAWGSAFS